MTGIRTFTAATAPGGRVIIEGVVFTDGAVAVNWGRWGDSPDAAMGTWPSWAAFTTAASHSPAAPLFFVFGDALPEPGVA